MPGEFFSEKSARAFVRKKTTKFGPAFLSASTAWFSLDFSLKNSAKASTAAILLLLFY